MIKFTVGIDPDSEKHGYAVFKNGNLVVCETLTSVQLFTEALPCFDPVTVLFSIENVMKNQFVYARNRKESKAAESKVAMHIGRCQQAQVELMRWLDHYKIPYVLHPPQSGNWKDKKALFEKITGWTGRSNEDSRAAAFFGFLGLKSTIKLEAANT